MYRLRKMRNVLVHVLCATLLSCAKTKPIVRDQLIVEKLRLRITKVRNAAAETRP